MLADILRPDSNFSFLFLSKIIRLQTPGRFEGELDSVTARINVLAQSMKVFEHMETGITKTIARQERYA